MTMDTDTWQRDVVPDLDRILELAVETTEAARALPLPADKTGVAALKGCTAASFALLEAVLKVRDHAAPVGGGRRALSAEETEDLLAGARRTLARTRPKDAA